MINLKRIRTAFDRTFRNEQNENLEKIEQANSQLESNLVANKNELLETINTKETSLQSQIDVLVVEGDSSVEAAQARVDSENNTYATLKERLDEKETTFAAQLADVVNISSYGVVGSGDETLKIEQAFSDAVSKNKILKLNKDVTYTFNKAGDVQTPAIIGNGATIILNQNTRFITKRITNIKFQINLVWDNASIPDSSWIYHKGSSDYLYDNITFNTVATTNGSIRTKVGIRIEDATNVFVNNIIGNGLRIGIQALGYCNTLFFNAIKFTNTETGLHCKGSLTNVTGGNYIKNIFIDDFSLINTKDQQNNYQIHKGADGILLEKCDGVLVGKVKIERAIERAFYNSCVNNITVDTIDILDTMGFKFAGNLRYDLQLNNIAENCTIGKIVARCTDYPEMHAFETYDTKNINVDHVVLHGNGIAHCPIMTSRYVKDFKVNNVTAYDIKRSMFEYVHWGARPAVPEMGIPAQEEDAYLALLDGLIINNFSGRNVNIIGYEVIRFVNYGSTPEAGTYRHKNIKVYNVDVDNTQGSYDVFDEVTGTANATNCTGLININDVANLRIKNCKVRGYKGALVNGKPLQTPIQIGSNSLDVVVIHEETSRNPNQTKYNLGSLWLSAGSEITFKSFDRLTVLSDIAKLTPRVSPTNPSMTVNTRISYDISGEMIIQSSGDSVINLQGFDTVDFTIPVLIGKVEISTGRGEYGLYVLASSGLSSKKNVSDAVFEQVLTDGKIALYKDANLPRYIIRDKSGTSTRMTIKYQLSVA